MNDEFAKEIKRKRKKKLFTIGLLILILGIVVFSINIEGNEKKTVNKNGDKKVIISIYCNELSSDLSKLKKTEVLPYIPENGIILDETVCNIKEGDTVFDVLDRVCREKEIQTEYSYTPGYDSYYIESINYIYEKYAGKYSGWTYQVNGEEADYGCSQYKLKGGEKIEWNYVCD